MPGCTVLNCSNSSQKGYKLYHFPSDPERCAVWVKYCGREEGWQPTKHTCLCEVHFEESQFESHRADGLKKLKPFAVPTKFSKSNPNSRIVVRKKSNEDSQNAALKSEIQKKIRKKSLLDKDNENQQNPSMKPLFEGSGRHKKYKEAERNKRKRCLISESCEDSLQNVRQELEKAKQQTNLKINVLMSEDSLYSSRSNLNENKLQCGSKDVEFQTDCSEPQGECDELVGSPKKKYTPVSRSNDSLKSVLQQSAMKNVEETLSSCKKNICFICDQNIKNSVPLSSCTKTSKTQFGQKLVQLVVQEFDILVENSDVLCEFCAQMLNCIDYVESVYHTLSKGILNRVKKKFGMGPTEEIDLLHYIKSLRNLNDFYNCKDLNNSHISANKHSNQVDLHEPMKDSPVLETIQNCQRKKKIKLRSLNSNFECQICPFETSFKAVMMFHLRKHFEHSYSCDFCNTPVVFNQSSSFNTSCKIQNIKEQT